MPVLWRKGAAAAVRGAAAAAEPSGDCIAERLRAVRHRRCHRAGATQVSCRLARLQNAAPPGLKPCVSASRRGYGRAMQSHKRWQYGCGGSTKRRGSMPVGQRLQTSSLCFKASVFHCIERSWRRGPPTSARCCAQRGCRRRCLLVSVCCVLMSIRPLHKRRAVLLPLMHFLCNISQGAGSIDDFNSCFQSYLCRMAACGLFTCMTTGSHQRRCAPCLSSCTRANSDHPQVLCTLNFVHLHCMPSSCMQHLWASCESHSGARSWFAS